VRAMKVGSGPNHESEACLPVSVVLSVHNGQSFLAQSLESILSSSLPPLEVLVIDDGSTDRSAQIAQRFALTRVVCQPQAGIAQARNRGISLARGEFIAFNAYDDIWAPDKLKRQLEFMRADPELDIALCMMRHFLEPGHDIPRAFRSELLDKPVAGYIPEAMLVRREVFARIGLFDPSYAISEDSDWFARVIDAGLKIAVVPDILLHKRVHGSNSSLAIRTNEMLLRAMRSSVQRKRAGKAISS
jgi:glycosyltransferase involved in cell wall biosynthesis